MKKGYLAMMSGDELTNIGINKFGTLPTTQLVFDEKLRELCTMNTCGSYGTSWACPPAVGTVSQCREKCLKYSYATVFNAVYTLEDSFDFEGMAEAQRDFKQLCDRLYKLASEYCDDFFILSAGGCRRCAACTYPSGECRFPKMLFPAVEGYGVNVKELADTVKIPYINGVDTVTYFGVFLHNQKE